MINRDPGGGLGKSAALDRLKAAGSTIPAAGNDVEILKAVDLQAKMTPHPSDELSLKRGSNANDSLTTATLPEEMINKEARNSEPLISRMSALPDQGATNAKGEQPGGEQLTDENGNGHDTRQFMKKEAGRHLTTESSGQSFRPAHLEGLAESSADPQELLSGNRAESSADLQPAASRMKMAPGQSVELVSGHHDPASPTSDPQSNIIRQIVQRMALQTQGAQSTMTVKLKPEFLGNVHMQISTDNQQVVVRMATESLAVKEMVEQGLQHLKTELQNHGLEINKFDVFVAGDKEDSRPGQDLAGFRQALKERRKATPESSSVAGGSRENSAAAKQAEHGPGQGSSNEINYFV
jgi:flagellar hook-length control protein FliK